MGASQPAIGVRCSGCFGRCACPLSNGLRLPCLSVCASVSCLLERFAACLGFLLLITFLLRSLRGCTEAGLRDPSTKRSVVASSFVSMVMVRAVAWDPISLVVTGESWDAEDS